jgi:hypothetical protein
MDGKKESKAQQKKFEKQGKEIGKYYKDKYGSGY